MLDFDERRIGEQDAAIRGWLEAPLEFQTQSTDFEVLNYSGTLFNVSGSTGDPLAIPGYSSWKNLLVEAADLESARCYVSNLAAPDDTSHDNFSVGGHMTVNEDGSVEIGGISYLMPLCYWHNSTSRDGQPFEVDDRELIRLYGYMQAETFATFAARLPPRDDKLFSLVYKNVKEGVWAYSDLTASEASDVTSVRYPQHILLKKSESKTQLCQIKKVLVD